MDYTDTELLLAINFFHAWNHGLIIPVLASHVVQIGGDQVTLGFMGAGMYIFQNLSRDFLAQFEHSSKLSLNFCLFISFLCHLMSATTDSCVVYVIVRWVLALVNSVDTCSKELIVEIEPEEKHAKCFNLMEIVKAAGVVTGAIVGGHIYNYMEDFELNALLAAISTLLALLILQQTSHDGLIKVRESNLNQVVETCCNRLKALTEMDYLANFDLILLHTVYMSGFILFILKYPLLIKYNYQAGVIIIGYTVAYQSMLYFAANNLVLYLKSNLKKFNILDIFDHCLLISSVTLLALNYAPTYDCYLVVFIPMVFSYAMVNYCAEDELKRMKNDDEILEARGTIIAISHIVSPIIFGYIYRIAGIAIFKVLSTLPSVAVCAYLVKKRLAFREEIVNEITEEVTDDMTQEASKSKED